jgi:hypothetical protein
MATNDNLSYKALINFNQDLIKNTQTFKKLKHSPVIEVENDLYKIDLETDPDVLINVICINIKTEIRSSGRDYYYQLGTGLFIPSEKEIKTKCHFIAKKIQDDIIREAKEIYNNKIYN